jgi:hypothetical protein
MFLLFQYLFALIKLLITDMIICWSVGLCNISLDLINNQSFWGYRRGDDDDDDDQLKQTNKQIKNWWRPVEFSIHLFSPFLFFFQRIQNGKKQYSLFVTLHFLFKSSLEMNNLSSQMMQLLKNGKKEQHLSMKI